MVQQDRFSRDYYSPRGLGWDNCMPPNPEDNRYQEQPQVQRRLPPLDQVLREYASIPGNQYFLAVLRDDGVATFSSPKTLLQGRISRFFDAQQFKQCMQPETSASTPVYDDSDAPFESDVMPYSAEARAGRQWGSNRRFAHGLDAFEEDGMQKGRKRPRASAVRRQDFGDDDIPTTTTSSKRAIIVGNEKELWEFYETRFRGIQQSACKLISKAWIKAVEPKKQSTHPYTGKDEKSPDWWPQPWGEGKDDRVRHKEPDHLYKKERLYLLNHILRLVVEPNERQHKDIKKLHLNVTKLEEVTTEALSSFFADKDNSKNAEKKPYLKEIFKVALQQERFLAGEIDPTTKVFVLSEDKLADGYMSDNEEPYPMKQDDELAARPTPSISPPGESPHGVPAHTHSSSVNTPDNHIQGVPYVGEIPVRGAQYAQSVLGPEIHQEPTHYVEGVANMSVPGSLHQSGNLPLPELYTSPHEPSRRPSFINPHSDYNSPTTPTVYHGWGAATSAPNNPPMYTIPGQQPSGHHSFGQPGATPLGQSQQYLGPGYDGLQRAHDSGHVGNLFRSGSVNQGHVSHAPGVYSNYMHQDSRGLTGSGVKMEALNRNIA